MHNDELISALKQIDERLERIVARETITAARLTELETFRSAIENNLYAKIGSVIEQFGYDTRRIDGAQESASNAGVASAQAQREAREAKSLIAALAAQVQAIENKAVDVRKFRELWQHEMDREQAQLAFGKSSVIEPRHVILYGNPVDGFNVVGPFSCRQDAVNYGETEPASPDSSSWWVAKLEEPALTDRED